MADPGREPHWRSAVDVPLIVLATATVLSLIRSIDQPEFLARARRQRGHSRAHGRGARGARRVLRRTRLLGRGSCPRPARAVIAAAAAFAAWLFISSARTAPTRSSPPSSCSSTACSRSASCSSCGEGCSSGCSWASWSPSRSWRSAYGLLAFFDAPFVDAGSRRADSRRSSGSTISRRSRHDARGRARGAVHAGPSPRPPAARRRGRRSDRRRSRRRARRAARALPRRGGDRRGRDRARRRVRSAPSGDARPRRSRSRSACSPSARRPGRIPPLRRDRGAPETIRSATPRAGTSG